MNINEVEKLLSVSRSNIRFYEKEGLICPQRKENKYRDYSEADVAALKKILVFRKLGFTVEEIGALQDGGLALDQAAKTNIARLEETIDELRGALEMTKKMASEALPFSQVDEDRYWAQIQDAEESGAAFIDVCRDYLAFELDVFDDVWKRVFFHDFAGSRKKYGIPLSCGILLLICVIRGLSRKYLWGGTFWDGFLYPFVIFTVVSLIFLPIYILRKRSPKWAERLTKLVTYAALAFLLLIAAAFVVLLFKNVIFA